MRSNSGKPLGIYVHIPFCKSKCEYCDFYSLGGSRDRRTTARRCSGTSSRRP